VQEGCTVTYWTGNATWTFKRLTAQGCTIPELHVTVQPGPDTFDFVGIAIVAKSSYKGRLLETDRFLFLQGDYPSFASRVLPSRAWSGMELLLDQRHFGKVFIQGIFVAKAPSYKKFGLNYTGKCHQQPCRSDCACLCLDSGIYNYLTNHKNDAGREREGYAVRHLSSNKLEVHSAFLCCLQGTRPSLAG